MLSFPLLGRSRSWAVVCLFSLLSLFFLVLAPSAGAQGYPGSGGGGSYPGSGGGGSYPGSYGGPTYSGGTVVLTHAGLPTTTTNYSNNNDGSYGGGYYCGAGSGPSGTPDSASVYCSGAITATFNWNNGGDPNNTPPKCVIVTEHCTVTWSGEISGGASVDGGCTNPLGGSSVPATPGPGATWDYTRYTVQNDPPATLTLSCDAEADAEAASGSIPNSSGIGSATVNYSASVTPIVMDIRGGGAGGVGASDTKHFMIGQSVFAFLNTGNLQASSYNWTVSGGNPFDNYAAFNDHATYSPLFSVQSSISQSVYCYFAKPDRATFTCQSSIMGCPVTMTRDVLLEKPSAELSVQIGSVVDYGDANNPTGFALALPGYAPHTSDSVGIKWTGNVLTPVAFDVYDDIGQWNWTQLAVPDYQQVKNGQTQQLMLYSTNPATPINGVECLDNVYPYGSWYSADGTDQADSDAPDVGFIPDISVTRLDINSSFHDYLMYQPPGSDSVVVPLKKVEWFWQGQGNHAGGVWSTSNKNAQWGFDGDFPSHPLWTIQLLNNYVNFPP